MRGLKSRAIRDVAEMGVAGGLSTGLQLLIGVVSARALAPEGRGVLAFLFAWAGFVAHTGAFGLDVAVGRAAGSGDLNRSQIVAGVAVYSTLIAFVSAIIYGVVTLAIPRETISGVEAVAFAMFAGSSAGSILLQAALLGFGHYRRFALVRPVLPALVLAGYLLLWFTGDDRAISYFLAYAALSVAFSVLLAHACGTTVAVLRLRSSVRSVLFAAMQRRREVLAAGVGRLLGAAEASLPIMVITATGDPAATGLFVVASVTCSVQALVADAYARHAFGSAAAGDVSSLIGVRAIWAGQLAAAAGITPFAYLLLPWVYGEEFAAARDLVPFLSVAAMLSSVAMVMAERLRGLGLSEHVVLPRLASIAIVTSAPFLIRGWDVALVVALAQVVGGLLQSVSFSRSVAAARASEHPGAVLTPGDEVGAEKR